MLRVKNEARWLRRVLKAIKPICERTFVFDDHSTDATPIIAMQAGATVFRSKFAGLDESRDKDFLLEQIYAAVPQGDQHYTRGNPECPYWALAIDGDEELVRGDEAMIRLAVARSNTHAYQLRIPYLWDDPGHIRVDRVYRAFERIGRPSLFRLMNHEFRFLKTPFGRDANGNPVNFHCSSIPQEMLSQVRPCAARLMHWGYLNREDRLRKFYWYNTIDPNNAAEDCYRHMVQGDLPEYPVHYSYKHAGPLQLEAIQWQAS